MKKHYYLARCVVALSLIWVFPAWGKELQIQNAEKSIIETMVVTAGRIKEKKEDLTTNITILTEEKIKQSYAQDLGDLLGKEGFMIREYPNSTTSVSIRGFKTANMGDELDGYVLILINGRRAGTGDLSRIMMDNVERIEIIRGPGAVQYGASAMGGVVNVITKKGKDRFSAHAEEILGSWNYQKTSIGMTGQFNAFDLSFTASKASQDDYDTGDGSEYSNTGFDAKKRISLNTGWTFAPKNRIGIIYTGYEGEGIGSPGYLVANDPDDYVDNDLYSVDLIYDGQTRDEFLSWNLRYFKGENEYESFDPETYGNVHDYFKEMDRQGAQAQVTANWDLVRVTAGIDWINYALSNTYTIAGEEHSYDNPAAFFMAKAGLLDNTLMLSIGGRYDQYEVESDEGQSKDNSNWTSSIGAVYKLIPGLSVRANYAEAFKMPSPDQLFMFDDYSAWGFGVWSGNENLQPEKSKTYEIGMDFNRSAFSSSLTWFYTKFDNKIGYSYIAAQDLTRYDNIDGATISGIEGSLKMDVAKLAGWSAYRLTPYVSFTYLTEYTDEENDIDLQLNPEWTASYGLRFAKPDAGFNSSLNFAYTGSQDITDYVGNGQTSLDSFTIADLVMSKTLLSFNKYGDLSIKAEIRNLLDKNYEYIQGYPMPGRTFYVGLKYVF